MSRNEGDHGIPRPAFFDPSQAIRKAKPTFFGSLGPHDAREAERLAADKDADRDEDQENGTRK